MPRDARIGSVHRPIYFTKDFVALSLMAPRRSNRQNEKHFITPTSLIILHLAFPIITFGVSLFGSTIITSHDCCKRRSLFHSLFSKCDAIKQYYKSIIMSLEQLIHATRPLSPTAAENCGTRCAGEQFESCSAERWVKEMHWKTYCMRTAWLLHGRGGGGGNRSLAHSLAPSRNREICGEMGIITQFGDNNRMRWKLFCLGAFKLCFSPNLLSVWLLTAECRFQIPCCG